MTWKQINSLLLGIHKSIDSCHVWQWSMPIFTVLIFWCEYLGIEQSLIGSNTKLCKTLMSITLSKIVYFRCMILVLKKNSCKYETNIFLLLSFIETDFFPINISGFSFPFLYTSSSSQPPFLSDMNSFCLLLENK